MNTDSIRHYIFDLYGTLVDIHTDEDKADLWEKLAARFKEYGADYDEETLKESWQREISRQDRFLTARYPMIRYPEIRIEAVFRNVLAFKGVLLSDQEIREIGWYFRKVSTEYIRLYPGAKELLHQLRQQGKVWLLSNAQSIFTRPELEELGLSPYFDGIYISSEQLCKKPDRHFFQDLLDEEEIWPEEAVMIGNDEFADIEGARGAGLYTIYLHSNLSPEFQGSNADLILNPLNLGELAGILEAPFTKNKQKAEKRD